LGDIAGQEVDGLVGGIADGYEIAPFSEKFMESLLGGRNAAFCLFHLKECAMPKALIGNVIGIREEEVRDTSFHAFADHFKARDDVNGVAVGNSEKKL
jgi:hypothetical protein